MEINFVDLKRQYGNIKKEVNDAINDVLESSSFILGSHVSKFEKEFADFCNTKHCVSVDSGTSSLKLALMASGIKSGDEVITSANTYIATALAISEVGAKPVFVELNPDSYNINTSKIENKITSKTRAILPVHLYGQCADMTPIMEIAEKHDLKVVEDACQSHGSLYKNKRAGSIGNIGCFSFYPGKNLGAYGDGGAITTNNEEFVEKLRMLRDYGQKTKYHHLIKGFNNRLDSMQAAILSVKLKYLEKWNESRRKTASFYTKELEGTTITPKEMSYGKHVYHLYVIRVKNREQLINYLKSKGIQTNIHYPIPIYLQKAYSELNLGEGSFPLTESYAKEILSLPMFPELTTDEAAYVVKCVKEFGG